MVKHEVRVGLSNTNEIQELIQKAYYEEGDHGKIMGKNHYLVIDESDDINYTIFKGLDGATIKDSWLMKHKKRLDFIQFQFTVSKKTTNTHSINE